MRTAAASDAELLEASKRGDRAAFGTIVERYQRVVRAVAFSGARDRALGDDVAQDTFVTAWRQLGSLRDAERLPAWLCGIARNLTRAARRQRDREAPIDSAELATTTTPFETLSERQDEHIVAAALARVPDTYREPLVLYYYEDRSVADVARVLGISQDATHQRLSRGRQYLATDVAVVERSLRGARPSRDLVAAVAAAIALLAVVPHVEASTIKGSTMLKLGTLAAAVAAIAGTGYLVNRSSAAPAAVTSSPPTLTTSARTGANTAAHRSFVTPIPSLPAASDTSGAGTTPDRRAAAIAVGAIDCAVVAQHFADMIYGLNPADATMEPRFVDVANHPFVEHIEATCAKHHWTAEHMACLMAADDIASAGINCTIDLGEPGEAQDGFVVIPTKATIAPGSPDDVSCAAVGKHLTQLTQPDLDSVDPAKREHLAPALAKAQAAMPSQVEAACEQAAWPEAQRRCMVAVTSSDGLAACHMVTAATAVSIDPR